MRSLSALAAASVLATATPAAPSSDPDLGACLSSFGVIQVLGDFNAWFDAAEGMSQIGPCLWSDTLFIDPGCTFVKFRTELEWFPSPNYGRCFGSEEPCQSAIPFDGTSFSEPTCLVGGELGTAIGELEFLDAGDYEFTLDEEAGTYGVRRLVTAPGTGLIRGSVAFDDPFFPPFVDIVVFAASSPVQVAIDRARPPGFSFEIQDVAPGQYVVLLQAPEYDSASVFGVSVTASATSDLGVVTLHRSCVSPFSTVQILGEFNEWNENAPSMSQAAPCVWADTLAVAAGCSFLKFRTDESWDLPPDYGRCDGSEGVCQLPVPVDQSPLMEPTCLVQGLGTAIGQLVFPLTAVYAFRLDEDSGTYSIRLLSPVSLETESWGKIKARYRR